MKNKIILTASFVILSVIILLLINMSQEEYAPGNNYVMSEEEIPVPYKTIGEKNAYLKAVEYLSFTHFSKQGLKDQLLYEGFTEDEARFGVGTCGADWMEQAYLKALDYLDFSSFSRQGLQEQLEYEGFTKKEAAYGAGKAYK